MILALLLAAGAPQASLDDPVEDACYAADFSQQAMTRCAGDAYQRADTALNAEWAKVVAAYRGDKEGEKLMLDAQRAWLKYRDAHCLAAAIDSQGGSIWPMLVSGCRAALTRRRTRELVEMREGEAN